MSDNQNSQEEIKEDIETENLLYLLDKYGIDIPSGMSDEKWYELTLALARDKVKGFSDAVIKPLKAGRPLKSQNLADLQLWYIKKHGLPTKPKKRGAPTVPKLDPAWIDAIKTQHGLSGHGSDKMAIEILVASNWPPGKRKSAMGAKVKYVQKQLSEARRKIPKNK